MQEILERPLAVENASFYLNAPISELSEGEFIRAVLDEADCLLHLDVNNVYVNGVNFGYNASAFLAALPAERVNYIHVAGHYQQSADLIIDTHGADVIDPVWRCWRSLCPLRYPANGWARFQHPAAAVTAAGNRPDTRHPATRKHNTELCHA